MLEYLAASDAELTFKGDICLAKIHGDFYRLSEELDFSFSSPRSGSRKERSGSGTGGASRESQDAMASKARIGNLGLEACVLADTAAASLE